MDSGIAYNAPRKHIVFNSLDYYLENDKTLTYLEADSLYTKNTDMPLSYADMIDHFNDDLNLQFSSNGSVSNTITSTTDNMYILTYDNTKTVHLNENTTIIGNDMVAPSANSASFIGNLSGNSTNTTTSDYANTITGSTQSSIIQAQNVGQIGSLPDLFLNDNSLIVNSSGYVSKEDASTIDAETVWIKGGVALTDSVSPFSSTDPWRSLYGSQKSFRAYLRPLTPTSPQQTVPHLECGYLYSGGNKTVSYCDLRHNLHSYNGWVSNISLVASPTSARWDFWTHHDKTAKSFTLRKQKPAIINPIVLSKAYVPNVSTTSFVPVLEYGSSNDSISLVLDNASIVFSVPEPKAFTINHPIKKDYSVRHSCVESPRFDNIYRDKITLLNGVAEINLDNHFNMMEGTFVSLNREFSIYTSNETSFTRLKSYLDGNVLHIIAKEPTNDNVSFMVIGERQDDTIFNLPITNDNGKLILERSK